MIQMALGWTIIRFYAGSLQSIMPRDTLLRARTKIAISVRKEFDAQAGVVARSGGPVRFHVVLADTVERVRASRDRIGTGV